VDCALRALRLCHAPLLKPRCSGDTGRKNANFLPALHGYGTCFLPSPTACRPGLRTSRALGSVPARRSLHALPYAFMSSIRHMAISPRTLVRNVLHISGCAFRTPAISPRRLPTAPRGIPLHWRLRRGVFIFFAAVCEHARAAGMAWANAATTGGGTNAGRELFARRFQRLQSACALSNISLLSQHTGAPPHTSFSPMPHYAFYRCLPAPLYPCHLPHAHLPHLIPNLLCPSPFPYRCMPACLPPFY